MTSYRGGAGGPNRRTPRALSPTRSSSSRRPRPQKMFRSSTARGSASATAVSSPEKGTFQQRSRVMI